MFDAPSAGGDLFTNKDHVGDLLVVKVTGTEEGVQTENGPADVILADVTVVNEDGTVGEVYEEAMLFGRQLYGQLKRKVGRTVLGVFWGRPGEKVNGKNVPYRLDPATPEQEQLAMRAMTDKPDAPAAQPAAKAAPAAADDTPPWEK